MSELMMPECDLEKDIPLTKAILNGEPHITTSQHANYFLRIEKNLRVCEAKTDELQLINLPRSNLKTAVSHKGVAVPQRASAWKLSDIKMPIGLCNAPGTVPENVLWQSSTT
ncbi:hypothetical protein Tco_1313264 [Tanacetum coccineum]